MIGGRSAVGAVGIGRVVGGFCVSMAMPKEPIKTIVKMSDAIFTIGMFFTIGMLDCANCANSFSGNHILLVLWEVVCLMELSPIATHHLVILDDLFDNPAIDIRYWPACELKLLLPRPQRRLGVSTAPQSRRARCPVLFAALEQRSCNPNRVGLLVPKNGAALVHTASVQIPDPRLYCGAGVTAWPLWTSCAELFGSSC